MLLPAIILITLALVFYSVGIWAERIQKQLKIWHAVFFGLGLAADASGTWLMTIISDTGDSSSEGTGGILIAIMGVTGVIALALMAIHFVWAVVVLVRNREKEKHNFHRFSVVVWAIWLVPYITGAVGANL
ncbi:MAG: HsmA family protein [Microbacteriaceae bacterium]